MLQRIIPSSGESLPVIGIGTWQTFDVTGTDIYPGLEQVLRTMYNAGGSMIDSSPMYGRSEEVIGNITSKMDIGNEFFYATKVWTTGRQQGIDQIKSSMQKMQREVMDLIQVHNLVDWQTHLKVLQEMKEEGRVRYIGITHYTDAYHEELEKVLRAASFDFVQFNYSIDSRHAEKRLLAVAAELGVATIVNRPFGEGRLFAKTKNKPLPAWAADLHIESWAAYFLNYVISDPAVTCVIPATSNIAHAAQNYLAGNSIVADAAMRRKMIACLDGL